MIFYGSVIRTSDTWIGYKDTNLPYSINECGYFKIISKNVDLKRERVDFYLIYLISGKGHYLVDGSYVEVPAGSIVIYYPTQYQDYFYLAHEQAEVYWIHFTGLYCGQLLEQLGLNGKPFFNVGIRSECIELFEKIIHEIQIRNPLFEQRSLSFFLQLITEFARYSMQDDKSSSIFLDTDMERVIGTMHTEYGVSHGIDYYARICNMSLYQFIRRFKAATHLTPAKYIEKIKIDKSRDLLANSNLTITEISDVAGFMDPSYFSKVFRKVTGLSPIEFRTKAREA